MQFVRSEREANIQLYKETLNSLMPWVMVLDRTNYARNIPVYLRDLCTLEERHPDLYMEFSRNGTFMGQKTKRAFSKLPIDQCNEHLICWLKQESAVIGNLDNDVTVRREQVARPELARIVAEFEGVKEFEDTKHHEQFPKFQADFQVSNEHNTMFF